MNFRAHDPLLLAAHVLLRFAFVSLILGAIVVAAMLQELGRGELMPKIAAEGLEPGAYWVLIASQIGVFAMLFLGWLFLADLDRIVVSVGDDESFRAQNAKRLARMAWLALAIQLLAFPIQAGADVALVVGVSRWETQGPSLFGLVLVLTLFILSRVFRAGTELREDLEGTV